MRDLAFSSLEKVINRTLDLDPEAKQQLAALAGHTVALHLTDWRIKIILELTTDGIIVLKDEPETIDAVITGTLFGVMKTACAGGDPQAMRNAKLRLEGDIELAESLRNILSGLDLDWEAPLARCVGQTAAGAVGTGVRGFMGIIKKVASSGREQIATFLKTDSGCLPSVDEVNQFNRAVTVLRHDVERAAARINQIREKRMGDAQ